MGLRGQTVQRVVEECPGLDALRDVRQTRQPIIGVARGEHQLPGRDVLFPRPDRSSRLPDTGIAVASGPCS